MKKLIDKNFIKIKKIISKYLDNSYKIFIFGSRAEWNYRSNSDYDIWIEWNNEVEFRTFLKIRSELDELPILFDLVDFKKNWNNEFIEIAKSKIIYL